MNQKCILEQNYNARAFKTFVKSARVRCHDNACMTLLEKGESRVYYRNTERARFSKQRNERVLLLFKTYIYIFLKVIFDIFSGCAASIFISIIKLRLCY